MKKIILSVFWAVTIACGDVSGQVSFEVSGTVIKNQHGFVQGQKAKFLYTSSTDAARLPLGENGGHFYRWAQSTGPLRASTFWSHLSGSGLRGKWNPSSDAGHSGVMMYNWAGLDLNAIPGAGTVIEMPSGSRLKGLRIYGFLEGFDVGDMKANQVSLREYFSQRSGTFRYVKDQGGFINDAPNVGGSFFNPEFVTISIR